MKFSQKYGERFLTQKYLLAEEYRATIVLQLLKRQKRNEKNFELLDVGCGQGRLLYRLRQAGYRSVSGADYLTDCVNALKRDGFPVYRIDLNIANSGLPDKRFDVISILEVLEHLYDPASALLTIKSRLKRNGLLIASVPNEYRIRKRINALFGQEISDPSLVGGHIKFFGYYRFRQFIENLGFSIVEHFGAGGITLKRIPLGTRLLSVRPDLFAKWTFIAARPFVS